MTIVTNYKNYTINQGTPTVESAGVELLSAGVQGTPGALRRMTHPETDIADLIYWGNPDQWTNMDNEALLHPITSTVQTLGGRVVNVFPQTIEDILVTEIWSGGAGQGSIPGSFWRRLFNYVRNRPNVGEYVTWEPRDINDRTFKVVLVSVIAGKSVRALEVVEVRDRGGKYNGGDVYNALDDIDGDLVQTGILATQVTLTMKLVADIT